MNDRSSIPPPSPSVALGNVPVSRAPWEMPGLAGYRSEWVLFSPGYTADPRGGREAGVGRGTPQRLESQSGGQTEVEKR